MEEIIALSKYRFEKAQDCLKIAIRLYDDKEYGYSQNRAYYAVFNAIRSITVLDGFDSSKHSGIIAYFNQNYVKTDIFDKECSIIIRKASTLREKSDYEDFYDPSEEDTLDVIEKTKSFLNSVDNYLKEVWNRLVEEI